MNILVVDDVVESRFMLESLLKGSGYEVFTAANGAEAFERLEGDGVDLIISDILMPVMDGFQLCKKVRSDELLCHIPFIIYTATYTGPKDEELAIKFGADRFIVKPCEPDVFLETVLEVIENADRGKVKPRAPFKTEEEETFKLYSDRLVRKLEKKMLELEAELARREKAEKETRKLFRAVEQSPSIVMITDPEGIIEYVNPKFQEITGYQTEEVLGTNATTLGGPSEEEAPNIFAVLNSGQEWRGIFHNRKRNGERYWERASISPVLDPSGSITQFVKVAEDITGQIEQERGLEQERARMQTILSVLDTGLSLIHQDKTIAWVNEKILKMFPHADTLGQICHVFFENRADPCDPCPTTEAFKTGKIHEATRFNVRDARWYHILSQPVLDKDGEVTQVLEAVTDVTRRKEMEDALKKNEERLKLALEASSDGLWDWNVRTGEVYFSPRYYTMLGFEPYELPQAYETWSGLLHPEDRESAEKRILDHIQRATLPFEQEFRLKTKSGHWKWVLGRGQVFSRDEAGRPVRVVGTHADISRLKEAELLLKESEARYRNIIETSPVGIAIHSEGKVVFANKAGLDLFGAESPEDLIGKPITEIVHPDNWDAAGERIERMLAGEKGLYPVEDRYVRLDGKTIDVEVRATSLAYQGKPSVQVIVQDITEKRKTERELMIRNDIARIFLTTPDETMYEKVLALILDITGSRYGIFGFINEGGEWVCPSMTRDIWDRCQIPDKSIIFPREKWGGLWGKAMAEGKSRFSNHTFKFPEGHVIIDNALDVPVIYRDRLIGNLLVGQKEKGYDESDKFLLETVASHVAPILSARLARDREQEERKRAEGRLFQVQKTEAIGVLAGGIAHDFNNILTAILGYTQLAMDQLSRESPIYADLEDVYRGGERARRLVSQILTFSRQKEGEVAPIQMTPIIKEALKLLRATLPATIEIRQQIAPELGNIMADSTQIHQIIMNLCTNAGHAMREEGGILEVALSKVILGDASARQHPNLQPGEYIKLSVSDTGYGIEPDVLDKIFDPYFTTKRRGEGTGLGLAVVHGIVEAYGGAISVYSEPKKGTIFHVYFPTIQEEIQSVEEKAERIHGGAERILFVDDEIPIAELGKRTLEQLGYRVETRTNPIEALALFRGDPNRFDLVITDMTMPRMTGEEIAQKVMEIRTDMPVILCTGFSEKMTREKAMESGIKAFLMKPLIREELASAVRKALGRD